MTRVFPPHKNCWGAVGGLGKYMKQLNYIICESLVTKQVTSGAFFYESNQKWMSEEMYNYTIFFHFLKVWVMKRTRKADEEYQVIWVPTWSLQTPNFHLPTIWLGWQRHNKANFMLGGGRRTRSRRTHTSWFFFKKKRMLNPLTVSDTAPGTTEVLSEEMAHCGKPLPLHCK